MSILNTEIMDFSKVEELRASLEELSSTFSKQYDQLDREIYQLFTGENSELSFEEKQEIFQTFDDLISYDSKQLYKEAIIGVSDLDTFIPSVKSYRALDRYLDTAIGFTSFDLNIEASNDAAYSWARTSEGKVEIKFSNTKLNESKLAESFKSKLENIVMIAESANKVVGELKKELLIKKDHVVPLIELEKKQERDSSSLINSISGVKPEIDAISVGFESSASRPATMEYHPSTFYIRVQ